MIDMINLLIKFVVLIVLIIIAIKQTKRYNELKTTPFMQDFFSSKLEADEDMLRVIAETRRDYLYKKKAFPNTIYMNNADIENLGYYMDKIYGLDVIECSGLNVGDMIVTRLERDRK